MLDTLHELASSLSANPTPTSLLPTSNYHHLSAFFSTPHATVHVQPTLFAPHLPALLTFLPCLILPPVDWRPFPGSGGSRQGAFVFPPASLNPSSPPASSPSASPASSVSPHLHDERDISEDDQKQTLRLSVLSSCLACRR